VLGWCWLAGISGVGAQTPPPSATAQPSALMAFKSSKTLELIRTRGAINIGVKTDFPPFGMLNTAGQPEGFEIDLATDMARQLGVRLNLVVVTTENRFQKLEQGLVDVLIATAADTHERRQIATAIEPNYYAGGVTVFLRPEEQIANWQAIRGHKICASQGAYFNRPMSQRYLLDLQMYRSTRDALMALRDGRCVGYLYSSAAVQDYLKKPEWAGYHANLAPAMVAPWAVFVSRVNQKTELDYLLGNTVAKWHRNGFLIEREAAWGIQALKFLADTQTLWAQRNDQGQMLCQRGSDGEWVPECRNKSFVRSDEVGGILRLGLWIEEHTGLKLSFVYDKYDRSLFIKGVFYTLILMGGSVVLSVLFGVTGALLSELRGRFFAPLVHIMAVYARMTPPLLQMYLLFFGVGALVVQHTGSALPAVPIAVLCMSAYTGASIMSALLEATQHIRSYQPQFSLTWRHMGAVVELSAAPVKAALVNVVKQSVLASALAVPELLTAAVSIMSDQGNVGVMMNVFLITFIALISLWIAILDGLQAHLLRRHKHHQKTTPPPPHTS
jgi:polar amino acid transport system substrate-binding protein